MSKKKTVSIRQIDLQVDENAFKLDKRKNWTRDKSAQLLSSHAMIFMVENH